MDMLEYTATQNHYIYSPSPVIIILTWFTLQCLTWNMHIVFLCVIFVVVVLFFIFYFFLFFSVVVVYLPEDIQHSEQNNMSCIYTWNYSRSSENRINPLTVCVQNSKNLNCFYMDFIILDSYYMASA